LAMGSTGLQRHLHRNRTGLSTDTESTVTNEEQSSSASASAEETQDCALGTIQPQCDTDQGLILHAVSDHKSNHQSLLHVVQAYDQLSCKQAAKHSSGAREVRHPKDFDDA